MRAALEAALPYLAPAGDGGLREALKKLVAEWSERATGYDEYSELRALLATHPAAPAVPQPAADSGHNHLPRCCCPTWQVAPDDHDYESRGGRIEREACPGCPEHGAPAAVPQPVDREALAKRIEETVTDALLLADDIVAPGYSARIEADADDIAAAIAPAIARLFGSEVPSDQPN
jgi:hypothetical protein